MKPVDQDQFGHGHGNCYSAAIASILERPLSDFAAFHVAYCAWGRKHDAGETVSWEERVAPNLILAELAGVLPVHVHTALEPIVPSGWSIANGPSTRGVQHSCVAFDGAIVHDPHESRSGLLEITDFEVLLKIEWPVRDDRNPYTMRPALPDQRKVPRC